MSRSGGSRDRMIALSLHAIVAAPTVMAFVMGAQTPDRDGVSRPDWG